VLREHKLTHTKPLVPDEADSNRHSHPPFCEPLVVTVTSKPIHVQPQQTVYNECTTGKDTILSADSAPDGANNYTHSEGETITDVTHECEDSRNDTEGHSTSDLQGQNSSQKVRQPSHKHKPCLEMHMVEYFKDYIEENGGEASICSLRRITFQNFRKKYSGPLLLSKNLFKSHPQDFTVVEGAGFCRIELEKCATEPESYKELVIPATESSPSICHLDTSDDQKNDLAPEQGSMVAVQQDAIVCRSESKHIQYQDILGHDFSELLTNPPLSAVCATSGANGAVVVGKSMSKIQPALVVSTSFSS